MNDDQLTQPQDAADAQDSSTGDEGTNGMNDTDNVVSMDDTSSTGDTGDTGTSDTQAQPADAADDSAADEPAAQADDAESGSADTSAGASADTTEEASSEVASSEVASSEAAVPEEAASSDEAQDADAGSSSAAPDAPVAAPPARVERSDDRPARPQQRQQYDSDEEDNPSDEMVIHTARDPRMDDIASNASMEDLMKASERQYRPIKHGDVIEGTVMKVSREEIMIDIGGKTEGVIASRESTTLTEAERDALQIGDTLLVSVVQPHNSEGQAVLSLDRARQEKAWRDLQRSFEAGETISAPVVGHNKGGILVNIEGIRGFVPSSQVSSLPPGEANKQAEMARLHNQSIPLKIIEINRHRNRLILSERQAMQEQRESMRAKLLLELESGQIRPGTVTSVCDFGAFVDIGGADGLIHLSELSWKRVSHPSEVLKVGDRINVYVLSVDQNERKIALSLKRTQPEPWETITDQYQLGQMVRGTITQITTFGAFARLDDGIEGLIHVSELAEGRVAHPRNVVKEGEVLDLKVIRIDPARKRIGLSLKRVNEDANREAEGASGAEGETSDTGSYASTGADSDGGAPSTQSQQGDTSGTSEQQPRQEQQRQEPRPPRPQQSQQSRQQAQRPPRGQQQPQQPLTSQSDDFEPLGALAAALAAHTQRADESGDDTAQVETAPVQAEQSDPGEVIGSLSGINTSADMDATISMGDTVDATDAGDVTASDEASDDAGDATESTPEMGAFGTASADETTDDTTGMTDVATDSGDIPSEDEQLGTDDTADDTATDADTSSVGDAVEDAGADEGGESEAATDSASDADADDASDSGDTGSDESSALPAFTDVVSDAGDMVGEAAEAAEASMPSSESIDADDATSTEDNGSLADISADDVDTSSASDDTSSSGSSDDADSGAVSGSEGAPSTGDSEG